MFFFHPSQLKKKGKHQCCTCIEQEPPASGVVEHLVRAEAAESGRERGLEHGPSRGSARPIAFRARRRREVGYCFLPQMFYFFWRFEWVFFFCFYFSLPSSLSALVADCCTSRGGWCCSFRCASAAWCAAQAREGAAGALRRRAEAHRTASRWRCTGTQGRRVGAQRRRTGAHMARARGHCVCSDPDLCRASTV